MEKIEATTSVDSKKNVPIDIERYVDGVDIDFKMNEDRRGMKYRKYSADFKLEAVDFSKNHTWADTIKKYRVSESNILLWRKQEKKLQKLVEDGRSKNCRLSGAGRKPLDYDMQVK